MGNNFFVFNSVRCGRPLKNARGCAGLTARVGFWLLIISAVAFTFPANATQIKTVEANGLKAWVVEDHLLPIVSIELAFKHAGNAYDVPEKMGTAYAVASMLNEGAGVYTSNEFQKLLEENAIEFSPDVDRDNFYLSINTLTENLDLAVDLMNTSLTKPTFAENDFARVKGQTATEIKQKLGSGGRVASEAFYNAMFKGHSYSNLKEGSLESLDKIKKEDLHKFTHDNFAKDNLVIAIVGDVDEEKARTILEGLSKDLNATSAVQNLPVPAELPDAQVTKIAMDNPQTTVIFGEKGLPRNDRDYYAAYLLNYILGGSGFGTRLMTEVREKNGLAYSIGTHLQSYDKADLLVGSVQTRNEGVDKAIQLISQEFGKVARNGVTADELQAAKDYIMGSFGLNLDKNENLAAFLITMQLYNLGIDYLDKRNNYFKNVTLSQINGVAKRIVRPEKLVFIRVGK